MCLKHIDCHMLIVVAVCILTSFEQGSPHLCCWCAYIRCHADINVAFWHAQLQWKEVVSWLLDDKWAQRIHWLHLKDTITAYGQINQLVEWIHPQRRGRSYRWLPVCIFCLSDDPSSHDPILSPPGRQCSQLQKTNYFAGAIAVNVMVGIGTLGLDWECLHIAGRKKSSTYTGASKVRH